MLQTIRDKTQGWFATVLIGLVCITFALWGVHYYLQSDSQTQSYVAKVNGKTIPMGVFEQALQQNQNQQMMLLGANYSNDTAFQKQLRDQVLNQLIQQVEIVDHLEKANFVVPPLVVSQNIVDFPAFQDKGQFSPTIFNQVLAQMGMSENGFYQQLASQLMVGQLGYGLTNSNYTLPLDLKAAIMLINETRDVGYIILSPDKIKTLTSASPSLIESYYNEHVADFTVPNTVQIEYLILPPSSDKLESLTNLSYEHPSELDSTAKTLGLKLVTSPFFSAQGKELTGILSDPKLREVAFSADVYQRGYNSDVITLSDGTALVLRVKQKMPAHPLPLKSVEPLIIQALNDANKEAQLIQQANTLSKALSQGAKGPTLAKSAELEWHEKTDVNRHEPKVNPKVLLTVFNLGLPSDRAHPTTAVIPVSNHRLAVVAFYQAHYGDYETASPEQKNIFSQKIEADYGHIDYVLYLRSLDKQAKIQIPSEKENQ